MSEVNVLEFPFVEKLGLDKPKRNRLQQIWDRVKEFEAVVEKEGQVVLPIVAASLLGVSTQRVSQMLQAGQLKTVELQGRTYVTVNSITDLAKAERKSGRPLKATEGGVLKRAIATSLRLGKAYVEEEKKRKV